MSHPAAFLCYPTRADRSPGQGPDVDGPITRLRQALTEEVRILTGEAEFDIFQDRTHVEVSQNWVRRIQEGLQKASVLIVLIQPFLFKSEWCREEITAFLASEKAAGRDDLIVPVLYVDTPELSLQSSDLLAATLAGRQYFDWRRYRLVPLDSPEAMRAVGALAEAIVKVLRRSAEQTRVGSAGQSAVAASPSGFAGLGPAPQKSAEETMYRFLMSAFSVDELSRLLRYTLPELAVELPGGAVAPATFFSEVVSGLTRHGAYDVALFDLLRRERPRRAAEITTLQRVFGA